MSMVNKNVTKTVESFVFIEDKK